MPYSNKEKHNEHQRKYRANNMEKIRESERRWWYNRKIKLFKSMGGQCIHCGINDHRVLQIDHINGGGKTEIKKVSRKSYYGLVKKNPEKYQLLCANCNWIKRWEEKE